MAAAGEVETFGEACAGQVLAHVEGPDHAALAHVLENAAAYSPASFPISVNVSAASDTLTIAVRDRHKSVRIVPLVDSPSNAARDHYALGSAFRAAS